MKCEVGGLLGCWCEGSGAGGHDGCNETKYW